MQAPQIGEVERAYPPLAIQAEAQYLLSLTNAGGLLVGFPGSHSFGSQRILVAKLSHLRQQCQARQRSATEQWDPDSGSESESELKAPAGESVRVSHRGWEWDGSGRDRGSFRWGESQSSYHLATQFTTALGEIISAML